MSDTSRSAELPQTASPTRAQSTDSSHANEAPRLWPYLLVCALAAVVLDFGHLHKSEHADSIIPVLVSLQKWTWFYWGQDRYGMFLPLLATPVHNPLYNLLLQAWFTIFSGFASFFLLARFLFPNKFWPIIATLAGAYVLLFLPPPERFDWFVCQPYATPLTLALAALLLVEIRETRFVHIALALLLSGISNWINSSASVVLILLLFVRWFFSPAPRLLIQLLKGRQSLWSGLGRLARGPDIRGGGVMVFGILSSRPLVVLATARVTNLGSLPLREWPHAWHQLGVSALSFVKTPLFFFPFLALVTIGTGVAFVVPQRRLELRKAFRALIVLIAPALIWMLLAGTLIWVKINDYESRYLLPSMFLIATLLAALTVLSFPAKFHIKAEKYGPFVAAVVLLALSIVRDGVPSLTAVRDDLQDSFGYTTSDVLASRVNLIAGDYWTVWPAVYEANLVLYDRGEHRQVYGVSLRAGATKPFWSTKPSEKIRIAIPKDELREGNKWLHYFGLAGGEIERRTRVDIFESDTPESIGYAPGDTIDFRRDGQARQYEVEGWGDQEEGGSWTLGDHSVLQMKLQPPPSTDLLLSFRGQAFVAPKRPRFTETLQVNEKDVLTWEITEPQIDQHILLPRTLLTSPLLRIEFIDHDPKSPQDVGFSVDSRKLGLYLSTFKLVPFSKLYELGMPIDFLLGGNAYLFEKEGWGAAEESGSWTLGNRSSLLVKMREAPPSDLIISFDAFAFIGSKRPSFVESLRVNGTEVSKWSVMTLQNQRQIRVPRTLAQSGSLDIEFVDHDPKSPLDVGASVDARKLGLYMKTLSISRAEPTP